MLLSFVAGLALGELRKKIEQTLILGVLVIAFLALLSIIPCSLSEYGDVQHLLPLSYPIHAEITTFAVVMIGPTPPSIRLTVYVINTPIIGRWYYTVPNAFLTAFAIFFGFDLGTMIIGTLLGRLVRDRL